ncbi:acyltransferase family protein [Aurantiacibacter flavus]|uniref:Acyltransferase n=1 Tax=Aurantiacibacter flavus TaxID=3145232 RepID=A0ABV0CYP4_9SPHN
MKYRAEIDGLRALAVVPVILFHAGFESFSGGFVGVDVFFVISGYLISTILIENIEKDRFSIVNFYEKRARRILPVLYLVAISSAVASSLILYPEHLVSFAKSLISTPIFLANFYFWSERGYFGDATELKPLIHIWSLAVEEQFYIFFPIFLLLIKNYKKIFYTSLVAAFVISIVGSYYVTKVHVDTAFYFPVTRAWELLAGAVAAIILHKRLIDVQGQRAEIISIIGLILIGYAYVGFDDHTPFPGIYAAVPVLGTFLYVVAASNSRFTKAVFSSGPLVFIGLISFSLYLWHQPIFALSRHLSMFEENIPELLLLTAVLSCLSYWLVETPFRNRSLISRKTIVIFSSLGGLSLIVIGAVMVSNDGFPNRYKKEDRALLTQLSDYKGYNQAAFDALQGRTFVGDSGPRIALIGDSYAKDMLNVFNESQLFSDVQFSTRQVNSECGNLYLNNYEVIEPNIPLNRLDRCKVLGWYGGDEFDAILRESDEIWLAASWEDWVIDYLPQSIDNLSEKYNKPVRVFGIKDFGQIRPYDLLSIPPNERSEYRQPASDSAKEISLRLHGALDGYEFFYPMLRPLCDGSSSECRIFTDEGLLMSADGRHLTKEGAIESSRRLSSVLARISSSLGER